MWSSFFLLRNFIFISSFWWSQQRQGCSDQRKIWAFQCYSVMILFLAPLLMAWVFLLGEKIAGRKKCSIWTLFSAAFHSSGVRPVFLSYFSYVRRNHNFAEHEKMWVSLPGICRSIRWEMTPQWTFSHGGTPHSVSASAHSYLLLKMLNCSVWSLQSGVSRLKISAGSAR